MFTLYHIKGKKWGCTNRISDRLKDQGYTLDDVAELIEIEDINTAADMERDLNIRDGYGWNKSQDYRTIYKACVLGGYVTGRKAVESGQIKQALARSCEVRRMPVRVIDKFGNIIGEYKSQREASTTLNISFKNISSVLSGKRKSAGGYKFVKI